jgi:uncharacterized protein YhaN
VVLALTGHVLERAARRYEERTQPEMLRHAGRLVAQVLPGVASLVARRSLGSSDTVELCVRYVDGRELALDRLSTGARSAVYLACRMGLISVDARRRRLALPILIDEPFAHLDDERWETLFDLLANMAGGHQMIVSTCAGRVAQRARNAGIPVVALG